MNGDIVMAIVYCIMVFFSVVGFYYLIKSVVKNGVIAALSEREHSKKKDIIKTSSEVK